MNLTFKNEIKSEDELRRIIGHPSNIVLNKTIDYIDTHCRKFIKHSPFITIGSIDARGNLDVSPKGDPPGFVKILDIHTLAIPHRPGNRKADTLRNILQNPFVGMIFLIPGIKESLRVNGTARLVTDKRVLNLLAHEGKEPALAIIVTVREAFLHCAKCMIRSKLWTTTEKTSKSKLPKLAKALIDHSQMNVDYKDLKKMIKEDEDSNLY